MSNDSSSTPAPVSTGGAIQTAPVWSNRDQAALPARALRPKSAAIQARRHQHHSRRPGTGPTAQGIARFATADAAFTFVLHSAGNALFLERTQRRPLGTHLVQAMVFASLAEFDRWCEAEAVRFEDPTLHERVRHYGQEHFRGCH